MNPLAGAQHWLDAGLRHHGAGQLAEAERCYREVLVRTPQHADALHLLGVIAYQVRRHDMAIELIGKAIAIDPNQPRFYSHISLALKESGRHEEALAACRHAIAIQADYAEDHYNLGALLFAMRRFDEAMAACRTAIGQKPGYAEAHGTLGNALKELGRFEEAASSHEAALHCNPALLDSHFNLGLVRFQLGHFEGAIEAYRAALAMAPHIAAIHTNLGNTFAALGRLDEAATAHCGAIAADPRFAEAHTNLGNILKLQGDLDAALKAHDHALHINPAFAEAHYNRGNTLKLLGRNGEAGAAFEAAIHASPGFAEAHSNLGMALHDQGRLDQALAAFQRAVQLRPGYAEAHYNASFVHLLRGDFATGWPLYEWRRQGGNRGNNMQAVRHFTQPGWDGQAFAGKTLLLHAEQGLGDTLQFCRYAPLVAQRGGKLVLEVQRPLLRLLSNLEGVHQVVAAGDALPAFDLQCPLMSLPFLFGTRLGNIPPPLPILHEDDVARARWSRQLAAMAKRQMPRIGIAWSGSAAYGNDARRSMPLATLAPLLQIPSCDFFSLQKEVREADIAMLQGLPGLIDPGPHLADFHETAAAIANLDLVITVDTAVAHLGGSLGKPVWIMLSKVADFRWLQNRSDSPWYPSVRLFRQDVAGDWSGVVREVMAALERGEWGGHGP